MASPPQPRDRRDFEIAIICALRSEADAVEALFDKFWGDVGEMYGKAPGDPNAYTTGVIGLHNVVLAYMPSMGKSSAASVASSFRSSFEGIKLALVVGICGGMPNGTDDEMEVLLGDIIISTALVEYDFGRRLPDKFSRKDTLEDNLGRPNTEIRSLLAKLQGRRGRMRLRDNTLDYLTALFQEPDFENARYPGVDADKLFDSTYRHKHHDRLSCIICSKCEKRDDEVCTAALDASCLELKCSDDKLVSRIRLVRAKETSEDPKPWIHYGRIASGNTVMKSGEHRDEIGLNENVIAFEMEGAGVWENFPCVVIKAVCDYADSHKNKKWQGYAAATAAACMKAFLKEWVPREKPLATALNVASKAHFLVPFGRNKQFIGRSSLLDELFAKLNPDDLDDCQRVAVAGLGGVGKTQIAMEAAFRIQKASPDCSVFWISAVSTASFEKGLRDVGQALQIPRINEDEANIKSLVKEFLSKESAGRWLLIIDNADDIEMLYGRTNEDIENNSFPALLDYLPFSRKGSILFTTRNQEAAVKQAGVNVIRVKEMSEDDSQKLLETSLIDKSLMGKQDVILKLLESLTYLPLAIKQAAAYMNQNTMSVSDYLEVYEADGEEFIYLLNAEFEDQGRYKETKNPIALTWLISFRQISNRDTLAKEYLCFMSCVAQQDIPHSLLPPATKRKELEAIGILRAYSFITKREGQDSYDIHRLVQIAMRNWLTTKGELSLWTGKALMQVSGVFPSPEHGNRAIWTTYMPHALRVLGFQEYFGDFELSRLRLVLNLGLCYDLNGHYTEAERLLRQHLEMSKGLLGNEHPNTIIGTGNLAMVLSSRGKLVEAEQMSRQTLELDKHVFGKEHPETLACMHNLAKVLGKQKRYIESEQMYRLTLELDEKAFGLEYPSTLISRNQLAGTLCRQEKYVEAEQMSRQTLELEKKVFGLDHPSTLATMHNLAKALRGQGKHFETEQMHRQTLEARKKVLGLEHPDTLVSLSSLAGILSRQGKLREAEELDQQALQLREKVLGNDHPATIRSRERLLKLQEESRRAPSHAPRQGSDNASASHPACHGSE